MKKSYWSISFVSVLLMISTVTTGDPTRAMKIGIHGPEISPTAPHLTLPGVSVFRVIMDLKDIERVLNEPQAQLAFEALHDAWDQQCVRAIISIRMECSEGSDLDCIPAEPEQALESLMQFAALYASEVEGFQIGNEIYGGPGTLFINGKTPDFWDDTDLEDAYAWLELQAGALRSGINQSGCNTPLIAPATTPGLVRQAARGQWICAPREFCDYPSCENTCLNTENEATPALNRLIAFSNDYCDALDVHLHAECTDGVDDVLTLLFDNPCGLLTDTPDAATCLEWSAAHAGREWLKQPVTNWPGFTWHADVLFHFYKNTIWCRKGCDELCTDPAPGQDWTSFVEEFETWFVNQTEETLSQFNVSALSSMETREFLHACYSIGIQVGLGSHLTSQLEECEDVASQPDEVYIWDLTNLWTFQTTHPDDWNQPIYDAFVDSMTFWPDPPCPRLPGDADGDGDIDLFDYSQFAECLTGPDGSSVSCACQNFDFDGDDSVTLQDAAEFQVDFGR